MAGKDRAETGEYVETTTTTEVLTAMRDTDGPVVTVGDVSEAVGCSRETARRNLTQLHEDGTIRRRKIGASAVIWWVSDHGKMEAISRRHDDDYYAQNPGWSEDLPDLEEGA
ncbi:DeoR family transcriptional regulator [Halococcus sp. AFM35]|uniref:DeoR family transcriptional regulator n=1 Tax=Halococcus sp. AFM35 TaxID=3421653 RepID=UPI003EC0D208